MTITLLFDLDDTLLNTNTDAFIPAYFQALSTSLADLVAPDTMLAALMGGTRAMMSNTDPALTLRDVFDAYFFPKLSMDRASLQPVIDRFYDEVFPSLGSLTKPIASAIPLMDWAFSRGHRVVIATNPLFPLKAIQHRLRWAGLAPDKYPFALVTSYENFHFTKENVAYYPEVLAQLGWPDDPVVMLGDDIQRDVTPTWAAGIPAFLVQKPGEAALDKLDIPQGTLESFRSWIENTDLATLRIKFESPQSLLANLSSTPAALATLTGSLPSAAWARKPRPEDWNLNEVICHLRDVEHEVNLPRLRKVLAEENPFVVGEVTDRWAEQRQYSKQDGRLAFKDFLAARKEMLSLLSGLQAEWSRPARHSIFGATNLQELVEIAAAHDRSHVQQAYRAL
jgi:FMN phosphatase YigB (HAD superfamily)